LALFDKTNKSNDLLSRKTAWQQGKANTVYGLTTNTGSVLPGETATHMMLKLPIIIK
jgi:hypothetical protein